ncbi:outer membrane beta-barrel protein [Ferrimonas kyonanensis]|uniref:outer membrane beta-barrel protein n=1 Tax=Ferrimonas kyonanensis TaxID=364763 RepID=UPI00041CBA74|nr:outer membrane beta-barrel protein [Ferrimonas kyonanensis]
MRTLLSMLIAGASCVSLSAAANDYQPANVEMGKGWKFTPQLSAGIGYDDNTAYSSGSGIDSWFWEVTPEFLVHAGNEVSGYKIGYLLTDGNYFDSSEDDYTDHRFKVDVNHQFTRRHRIDFNYTYFRDHEARGTGITEGRGESFDTVAEFNLHDASIIYGFGVPSATINADFELGFYDKDYTNLEAISQFRDYDSIRARTTLYWRLGAKSSLLLEWNGEDKGYDRNAVGETSRDSVDQQLLAGFKWDATSKTSGEVKIGYEDRNFDDGSREDFSGVAWQAAIDWLPRTYSKFTFETGARAKDPDTFGDYVEEQTYGVNWQHQWRQRFSTSARIRYVDDSYTGIDRDDERLEASVGATLVWRRWLSTELVYRYAEQDSNIQLVTYDKNVFLVSMRVSL